LFALITEPVKNAANFDCCLRRRHPVTWFNVPELRIIEVVYYLFPLV
jgi:hypothetical protein